MNQGKERERETCRPAQTDLVQMDFVWFWFWSHLGLPWHEQVGSTPSPGPVPEKLDLNLTDQTGPQTDLLNLKIKQTLLRPELLLFYIFKNRLLI